MNSTAEPISTVEPDVPAPKKRFSFKRVRKEIVRPEFCLNCGMHIPAHYIYCGNCGQENEPSAVSFGTFVKEAWEEFVKIDSKLMRTILPLLFKPGFLTTEYLAGKRLSYLSPFRMYVAISALFFLVFGIILSPTRTLDLEDQIKNAAQEQSEVTAKTDEKTAVKGDTPKKKVSATIDIDTSDGNQFHIVNLPPFKIRGTEVNLGALPGSIREYRDQQKELPAAKQAPNWLKLISEKVIRLNSEPMDALRNMASNGLPLVMFFLLPFYAIYMQVCYLRSKRLYVEHLVFVLHIHSFLFLAFAVDMIFQNPILNQVIIGSAILYNFLALRRVYGQSVMKTLWKMCLLGWGYLWLALFAFIGALVCSLIWTLLTL